MRKATGTAQIVVVDQGHAQPRPRAASWHTLPNLGPLIEGLRRITQTDHLVAIMVSHRGNLVQGGLNAIN